MAKKKAIRKTAKKSAKKARVKRVASRAATKTERGGRAKGQRDVTRGCPRCGTANEADMKFCVSCGAGLFEPCPSCGRESRTGVKFCGGCGVDISAVKKERQAEEERLAEATRLVEEEARRRLEAFTAAGGLVVDLGAGVSMLFIEIKQVHLCGNEFAWVFNMGSPTHERDRDDDELQHFVKIFKPFWLGQTAVTQAQWQAVMGSNPSEFQGDLNRPVERVSWNDAQEFCRRLSQKVGMSFRLPTEAEWEYACRAGTTTAYSFGDDPSRIVDYAWFKDNSGGSTHPVATKQPNAWGLYDMHGNVAEWCADWYDTYPDTPTADPQGPATGLYRVSRGGTWTSYPFTCRAATRSSSPAASSYNFCGFRVARTP